MRITESFQTQPSRHQNSASEGLGVYICLVEHFRGLEWDTEKLRAASPFQVVDPALNAILIRACADLADALDEPAIAQENRAFAAHEIAAVESLWSESHGQYLCFDRVAGAPIDSASVGGFWPRSAPYRQSAPRGSPQQSTATARGFASPATPRKTRALTPSAIGADRSGWWSTT